MSVEINSSELSAHMRQHYEAEEKVVKQLLVLEEMFREHHAVTLREMEAQKEVLDRLLVLTEYYEEITRFPDPCCTKPTMPYDGPQESEVLNEFCQRIQFLKDSNCRILERVHLIHKKCLEFEATCSQLDLSVESPLMLGDTYHKPISFFRELIDDLFQYYYALTLKIKCQAFLVSPENGNPIKVYLEYIKPSEDFDEYLQHGLIYCKCLRPKPTCSDPYPYHVKFEGMPPYTSC